MFGTVRVSLAALHHNARALQNLVRPSRVAFVVKSNAYGHGLIETALAVEGYASHLCVYALEEALALRDGGITRPIVVLGPIAPNDLDAALAAGLEAALWDTGSYARQLARAARRRAAPFGVHVKVNTGIARLGLEPHDAVDAIEDYARVPELALAGVFSHFASAEELDSPFTLAQLDRLQGVLDRIEPLLREREIRPIRHIAASAAAMLWPQTRLDMSRIGIALYGLWPSPQTREAMAANGFELRPALSYVTTLVAEREVEAGTSVGYGSSFHAPRQMRLGVVPAGYADGIPRLLSNRGAFVVDGARCPIVGRVAMNMTTIDLTNAPNAHPGSAVTLIGTDGGASVGAGDWAGWAETIDYEIVTRIPPGIPRLYSEA
ncbi:MAG: alanine racemase [Vulcanimicrobiaceae bacterium]